MFCKRAALLVALASLGGCTTAAIGDNSPFLGEAVAYNAALQIINPDPIYTADMAKPGDHGEKGAKAVERYRTDAVKDVVTTSAGGGDAGGGGSGSGSGTGSGGPN